MLFLSFRTSELAESYVGGVTRGQEPTSIRHDLEYFSFFSMNVWFSFRMTVCARTGTLRHFAVATVTTQLTMLKTAMDFGFIVRPFGFIARLICREKSERHLADSENCKFEAACCALMFSVALTAEWQRFLTTLKKRCRAPLTQRLQPGLTLFFPFTLAGLHDELEDGATREAAFLRRAPLAPAAA